MDRKFMPQKTLRQQAIVDTARKIISSRGIENLTVREIAKELNITDGALYRHFKSKKEIISLLIDDIEETLLVAIKEAAAKSKEPLKKLESILLLQLSYAEQRKGLTFIVINETLNLKDKELQRKMSGVIDKYLKMIKEILLDGMESGNLRKGLHLKSASIAFFGFVQSLVTLWALSGFKESFLRKGHINEMLMIYEKGIGIS
jgi:AcrR family transcriptional regulator